MLERLQALKPESMLDIGAGSGTYGKLFVEHFPHAYRIGVEVCAPYLTQFDLPRLYDEMRLEDVRDMYLLPRADVIILGDVLEHMTEGEALMVWERALYSARKAVYLSVPIVHYPQGPHEGNPFEEHVVDDYSHERILETFSGIGAHWTGEVVGVYEALTCNPA